jgi:Ni,Fe-hydrogenase III large subunit
MATIETPRGAASLHIEVHHGQIQVAHVTAPSSQHARLVPHVVEQAELADALVGIASLDLSPWEMDQ